MKLGLYAALVVLMYVLLSIFVQETCVVIPDELAVRSAPGGDVIGAVHKGDAVIVTGKYQRDPFPGVGVWMEIQDGNLTGYVDQRYCRPPGMVNPPRGARKE